jgi:hypothetical protein
VPEHGADAIGHANRQSLRHFESTSFWRGVSPESSISTLDMTPHHSHAQVLIDGFEVERFGSAQIVPDEVAQRAARAVLDVHRAGLPPVCALVFDELWTPVKWILGFAAEHFPQHQLTVDSWAWVIPPGETGWPLHRDWPEGGLQFDGSSRLLTCWLALSEVSATDAAIAIVPRSRDDALGKGPMVLPDESLAVALTGQPGACFYWDGLAAHRSLRSQASALGPRVSAAYVLAAPGSGALPFDLLKGELSFEGRLDILAGAVSRYGAGHAANEITPELRAWAESWSPAPQTSPD